MHLISVNYTLIWQLDFMPNIQFTVCGKCFNVLTKKENNIQQLIGKKRTRGSGLDSNSKERLRAKLQELREKRNADKGKKDGDSEKAPKPPRKKQKRTKEDSGNDSAKEHNRVKNLTQQLESSLVPSSSKSSDDSTSDESIKFGTFDYANGKATPSYLSGKKTSQRANYNMLKKLEAEKARAQELQKTEEGQEILRSQKLNLAMRKVQGEKVKDDLAKVKKSLKRKDRQYAKSQANQLERKRLEKQQQQKRLKKREENIQKRIEQKKAKKSGKGSKGKKRPGFEGKKKGFLS